MPCLVKFLPVVASFGRVLCTAPSPPHAKKKKKKKIRIEVLIVSEMQLIKVPH